MKRQLVVLFAILFVELSFARAQHTMFQSKILTELGKSIGYVPDSTLRAGVYNAGTAIGMPLIAEYDERHTITHLGFQLFSSEMKRDYASDVYNFLERYFLELYCWKDKTTFDQKLKDDKVLFPIGDVSEIKRIKPETPFSISRIEDKYYEVTWFDNDQPFLSVAFPVQYELLLGMSQGEIEKMLYDMIIGVTNNVEELMPSSFEVFSSDIYRSTPITSYQLESLNTSSYYYKNGDSYNLICEDSCLIFSALNVFQRFTSCNNPMKVSQNLYGFEKSEYVITLQQWLRYCRASNLTCYAAVEEEYEDGVKLLVLAENKDLEYNHILSVVIPHDFVSKSTAEFQVRMYAFIPTHNIKDLYQQYKKSTKKKFY